MEFTLFFDHFYKFLKNMAVIFNKTPLTSVSFDEMLIIYRFGFV